MDYETLVSLIGSLGFPIFCCIILFKQNSELRQSIDAQKDMIYQNNTLIEKFIEKIGDLTSD